MRVQVPAQGVQRDGKRRVPPSAGDTQLHRQTHQRRTLNPQEVFKVLVHRRSNTGAHTPHLDAPPLHRVAALMVIPLRIDREASSRPQEKPRMPYGPLLDEAYVVHLFHQQRMAAAA